jgi:hypothetical protein
MRADIVGWRRRQVFSIGSTALWRVLPGSGGKRVNVNSRQAGREASLVCLLDIRRLSVLVLRLSL